MTHHPNLDTNHPSTWLFDGLLGELEIRTEMTSRMQLQQECMIEFPTTPGVLKFHYVDAGHLWVRLQGGELLKAERGDLILLPHGHSHYAGTETEWPSISIYDFVKQLNMPCASGLNFVYGSGPVKASLITGKAQIVDYRLNPLWRSLQDILIVRSGESPENSMLSKVLHFAEEEARTPQPGSRRIIDRLLETGIMHGLREYLNQHGLLATNIREPDIYRVLTQIHEKPANDWTLESMSDAAGMSRSSFADRFTRVAGVPPGEYLIGWRMRQACELLRVKQCSVTEAAFNVGYSSEAAFARAFRRVVGVSPGKYARQ